MENGVTKVFMEGLPLLAILLVDRNKVRIEGVGMEASGVGVRRKGYIPNSDKRQSYLEEASSRHSKLESGERCS